MLDFDRLAAGLREALAKETTDSVDKWFQEDDKVEGKPKELTDYDKVVKSLFSVPKMPKKAKIPKKEDKK